MSALYDTWAALIAEHFLHETRFDPLHRAESEQQLYTRLPEWLRTLCEQPSAALEMNAGARVYRVEMSRQSLVAAVATDYQALAAVARGHNTDQVLLGHRLASCPGLADAFAQHGIAAQVCPENAVVQGVLHHFDSIRSDPAAPAFVTRLARVHGEVTAIAAPAPATAAPTPSHALLGWQAFALSDQPLALERVTPAAGVSVRLHQGKAWLHLPHGVSAQLNGQRVSGDQVVSAGDRLRLDEGDAQWQFIVTSASHGQE
jgi:hypothetical protein